VILAERFQNTYISVHEFIHSWEKEIYELNNLDYFTYLLINNLGYQIEHEYFMKRNKYPYLEIEYDEISTLSFNLGDSFESYIEYNFTHPNLKSLIDIIKEKKYQRKDEGQLNQQTLLQIIDNIEWNKEQHFISDIFNYVVLDSLYDFYNYDIGLEVNETDIGLVQFAEYITNIIVKLLENIGKFYLQNPNDSATNLFDNLLRETIENQEENIQFISEDEDDESESWKNGMRTVALVADQYLNSTNILDNNKFKITQLLKYLIEFTEDYAGIKQIEDIYKDDLYEFFSFWLLREIIFEDYTDFNEIYELYNNFFCWLEMYYESGLKKDFDQFYLSNCTDLENIIFIAKNCINSYSMLDSILEMGNYDAEIVNGFFEVVKILDNGFIRLRDIHFHREYFNVQVDSSIPHDRLKNCIIDANLRPTHFGWRMVNINYIYPQVSKSYIH
jgi:hypothetical protein